VNGAIEIDKNGIIVLGNPKATNIGVCNGGGPIMLFNTLQMLADQ
jgi:hypothetical protein